MGVSVEAGGGVLKGGRGGGGLIKFWGRGSVCGWFMRGVDQVRL
jgi:hypothetical protein